VRLLADALASAREDHHVRQKRPCLLLRGGAFSREVRSYSRRGGGGSRLSSKKERFATHQGRADSLLLKLGGGEKKTLSGVV